MNQIKQLKLIVAEAVKSAAMGNSAPNKKRDWIMSKVLEINAKKVIFWDDREKNVKAVQSLSDIKKISRHERC